jgi:hypothetical protein
MTDGQVIQVNITSLVNALLASPASDFGLALVPGDVNLWIDSREGGTPMQITATTGSPPTPTFTNITSATGTGGPGHFGGHGVQFADANGDGFADFYVTMNESAFGNMGELFYRNVNGTSFVEEAAPAGIYNFDSGSHGGVFADIDNDGDFDLFNGSFEQNRIYRNNGSAVFTDITTSAQLPARTWPTRGVAAFDMDLDGDLDIVAINGAFGSGDPAAERNEIYINNGNSTFTTNDLEPVFSAPAGQGITVADYDNDGDIDIFAANRNGDVIILRNLAGSGFQLVAPANIGITHIAGDGISFADIDNDGDLDVLLDDQLYTSNGNGTFTFRILLAGPGSPAPYMGGFADLDNDGDMDIVFPGASFVYLNNGTGTFSASSTFSIGTVNDPRSVAFADIDNDGDLDFFYAQKMTFNMLIRNNYSGPNKWLRIALKRNSGQAGAFGSRIFVYPAGQLDNVAQRIAWREVRSQDGYLAQNDPRVSLGVANHAFVDIRVVFPGGATTTLLNIPTNQDLDIQQ